MDTPLGNNTGANTTRSSETGSNGTCAHCGQSLNSGTNRGLEQFLGKIGISDDVVDNLKNQFQNVDVEQYLNTARDYLQGNGNKAKDFAKDNPGKVAAGVAVLAVGAGLLISALNRD